MAHKIYKRGKMPDGACIQIEDWSAEYPGLSAPFVVATYPVANQSMPGAFEPRYGKTFRCALDFNTMEQAQLAFDKLTKGTAKTINYISNMRNPKYAKLLYD